jgi:hypothetical protein
MPVKSPIPVKTTPTSTDAEAKRSQRSVFWTSHMIEPKAVTPKARKANQREGT